MSALPYIPADLPPAPRPRLIDPLALSDAALRAWQDGRQAQAQYIWQDGPTLLDHGARLYFPTFGQHAEQSRLLGLAGYRFTANACGWMKPAPRQQADAELEWARRLYAALHPGWRPR